MNTEATQDKSTKVTAGERLRQAREQLGLSHQAVAERLCLKLSTIRQIEEGNTPTDLAPTFLRGYIRSYAKLVHVPEEELASLIGKQAPINVPKVASMQGVSLRKSRKKRDGWLMGFTWLIVFVVLGLTGAWWWQNHQAQQEEIANMADQSTAQLNQDNAQGQSIPLNTGSASSTTAAQSAAPATASGNAAATQAQNAVPLNTTPDTAANADPAQTQAPAADTTSQPNSAETPSSALPTGDAQASATAADADAVAMTFKADCWLQVNDASGKTLFSGVKKGGETLNLKGKAPYKLKIGAPGAVEIQYQGKPVDLSRFVKSNRVARLTLAAQ